MRSKLITRREAAELSGITETTVKKAVDQRVIPARRRGSQSLVEVDDVPVLAMLGLLTEMRLVVKHKRQLRDWLRESDAPEELELTPALVVRRVCEVEQARLRAERYAELRDRWIVRDPAVKGGEPVIRGSRVGVHTLAARIAGGETTAVLAEDFPHIPPEAREVAVLYARANPRRGRPVRGSTAP
jgi:excisionase family DNA binding protein